MAQMVTNRVMALSATSTKYYESSAEGAVV